MKTAQAFVVALCLLCVLCVPLFGQQTTSVSQNQSEAPEKKKDSAPPKHKLGPFDVTINWRTRVEGWDWFQPKTGTNEYAFAHSYLRFSIGQHSQHFDWFLEGAQTSLLGAPANAVDAAPQGQLGLGGTYYAANGNSRYTFNGFVKQAFIEFKDFDHTNLKLGRFEFFDGTEVKPKDPTLATVIQTRIAQRLIGNFTFAAFQRSFDGAQLSSNFGHDNFTFFASRPTKGVFQTEGMGELDVDTYYGAYTKSMQTTNNASELRIFGLGYIDHRTTILKTDNRSAATRGADHDEIEIGTYGIDYVHVLSTPVGKFDFLGWGVIQRGSWGSLDQHSDAFVLEAGWQPKLPMKPWVSAGYSYGSGDGSPNDGRHGTFFQVLTTPRQYARFPFYNMMNNEDLYGTLNLRPASKLLLRSELHGLRLASGRDLWYSGGGAFQEGSFGFQGRPAPANGNRSLATVWDISGDYQINRYLSTTLYYGYAWGESVITNIYPANSNSQFAYLETNVRF